MISAPSGTGKSSLARRVVAEMRDLTFSVSFTTRTGRNGEQHGREYHFLDEGTFDAMASGGEFLEWAEVYGRRYGTGRAPTELALAEGKDLLLDIDVQGARQVRERVEGAVSIFLLPPDYATLAERLRSRASDSPVQVQHRLALARREAEEFRHYEYLVVNEDLDRATQSVCSVIRAERSRVGRSLAVAERVLQTFPAAS